MGVGTSSIALLRENEYLKTLSNTLPMSQNEPFWNQLFSYTLPDLKNRTDVILLEEVTESFCESLFANNQRTGNFSALVKVFLSHANELGFSVECENKVFVWQTCNALRIIRYLCKFLVENMTEDKIIEQFEACSLADRKKELSSGSVFEEASAESNFKDFISSLMKILIDVPVLNFTYRLHLEAVNAILVLLSVKMFVSSPSYSGSIYKLFFSDFNKSQINAFIHGLLQNFIEQKPPPEQRKVQDGGGSVVLGLASVIANGIWSVLPFQSGNNNFTTCEPNTEDTLLGHQSTLLLLVLINHPFKDQPNSVKWLNSYKTSLQSFRHIQGRVKGAASSQGTTEGSPSFHINLSRLYSTLCRTQTVESSTLLLYSLLHGNPDVKAFILSKTDIDSLVLPILQILYVAPSQNSHHIYMALIVLLILTEDDHFNKSVHDVNLATVPWYTDRLLTDVTLGDVIILVVLRTIQFNMYQLRDRYLHTNCLAALANMSSHFRSINSYAAQRIFELITALAKRHKQYHIKLTTSNAETVEGQSVTKMETDRNYADDIRVLEEVIRMLLEIVNSCLTAGILRHNSNLVYALLQKHESFVQLRQFPNFQDVLQNIQTIIDFFIGKLDQLNQAAMTIEEVHQVIDEVTVQLPSHALQKFPELKFRYIEEDSPEDFFVPYVWSLAFNKSGIFWNPGCVQLFTLEQSIQLN